MAGGTATKATAWVFTAPSSDLLAAAETQLPHGLVLDGELLVAYPESGRFVSPPPRTPPRPTNP
ncbi:hypothetical protein [Streptomyces sp. NPDC054901]